MNKNTITPNLLRLMIASFLLHRRTDAINLISRAGYMVGSNPTDAALQKAYAQAIVNGDPGFLAALSSAVYDNVKGQPASNFAGAINYNDDGDGIDWTKLSTALIGGATTYLSTSAQASAAQSNAAAQVAIEQAKLQAAQMTLAQQQVTATTVKPLSTGAVVGLVLTGVIVAGVLVYIMIKAVKKK